MHAPHGTRYNSALSTKGSACTGRRARARPLTSRRQAPLIPHLCGALVPHYPALHAPAQTTVCACRHTTTLVPHTHSMSVRRLAPTGPLLRTRYPPRQLARARTVHRACARTRPSLRSPRAPSVVSQASRGALRGTNSRTRVRCTPRRHAPYWSRDLAPRVLDACSRHVWCVRYANRTLPVAYGRPEPASRLPLRPASDPVSRMRAPGDGHARAPLSSGTQGSSRVHARRAPTFLYVRPRADAIRLRRAHALDAVLGEALVAA